MANFFMDTFSQILWLFQFVLKKVGDHLPDFVLEETDVCVICVFERDQRHITSEFFHFIMQTLPLIERNGMVVLTMKDVGDALPASLRETGEGGCAGCRSMQIKNP